uniref:TerD domain-containing protein n=1 Tax=Alexandrium monilatum TaxID=311494 RepID=A0A7S4Q754_9DINO|mmetsp:Transcript_101474/g.302676  ORF Transcript_101474/g.302676 Transcript_101474/m.302676 type:complete len:564 (+) Transcript_101474:130-1821(+)
MREPMPLSKARYGVAISWDRAKASVDLDLQAVIVDCQGLIVDAVFYNNLSAFNGAVGHSGDRKVADGKAYTESIWVNLAKLPEPVVLIIFVIAAYGDCLLRDVTGGTISVLEDWVGCRVREAKIERAMADVDAVMMMRRLADGSWMLTEIEEPPSAGSHFLDILEPTIGEIIRKEIPGAPFVQKVKFIMEKGCSVDFQETAALKRLTVGISGKLPRGYVGSVDLDVSAVLFSQDGKILGAVDYAKDEKYGVAHSGDYCAGHSTADDEVITLDLLQIPAKVAQVFFLLTVAGNTFMAVETAYARVADQACAELARYEIPGGADENGLIIARIFRTGDKRWSLQALGMFIHADNWRSAEDILQQVFWETPEKVHAPKGGGPLPTCRRFAGKEEEKPPATDDQQPEDKAGTASLNGTGSLQLPVIQRRRSLCVTSLPDELGRRGPPSRQCSNLSRQAPGSDGARSGSKSLEWISEGEKSDCSRTTSRRTHVRKGTFRLISKPDDMEGPDKSTSSRLLKPKFNTDSDMVPVDEDGPSPDVAKPRLCATGCSWASRLQFLGACSGGAS